ncbi:MAG: signal recognition particle-docking protein FtsY [Methylococcaceae bacterium]|nr:MAG: signal recognition particle-docking protein FtsY [Methylococcaceae bacterium]
MIKKLTILSATLSFISLFFEYNLPWLSPDLHCHDSASCFQWSTLDFNLSSTLINLSFHSIELLLCVLLLSTSVALFVIKPTQSVKIIALNVLALVFTTVPVCLTAFPEIFSTLLHPEIFVSLSKTLSFWLLIGVFFHLHSAAYTKQVQPISKLFLAHTIKLLVFIQMASGTITHVTQTSLSCDQLLKCNIDWLFFSSNDNNFNAVISWLTHNTTDHLIPTQTLLTSTHLSFALLNTLVICGFSLWALLQPLPAIKKAGGLIICFYALAFTSGISTILLNLPTEFYVLHEAFAVLLMLPLIAIDFYSLYNFTPYSIPSSQDTIHDATITVASDEHSSTEPETLLLRLKTQLQRSRVGLTDLFSNLTSTSPDTDDFLAELEANLIMADLGISVTARIIARLKTQLSKQQLTDPIALKLAVQQELLAILTPYNLPLVIPKQAQPFVILVVGVNGAGKTTTIGKLAKKLQLQGRSVMLAAGDTFRAAAVEQLQMWGERNEIQVVAQHTGADSASVIYDAVQSAQAKGIEVLIADTAGRLHTKANLMDELTKIKRIIGKLDEHAPHEVLLVLDGGIGQNALSQAKLFNEAVSLSGLVITKLDGTAKGGVIFALAEQTKIPIRFIGIGEGIDDLQNFNAEDFVDALFVNE